MDIFDASVASDRYLYHYTSFETAVLILHSAALRLGPIAATNDPRENRYWFPNYSCDLDWPLPTYDGAPSLEEFNQATRDQIKVACLTQDSHSSGRGFARPRMWAQYGEAHKGVCLVFDKVELDKAFIAQYSAHPLHVARAVDYTPGLRAESASVFEIKQSRIKALGAVLASQELVDSNIESLAFRKDIDWAAEHEYRYLVRSEVTTDEFIDISASIRGVFFGMDASAAKGELVRTLVERLPVKPMLGHVSWVHGRGEGLPSTMLN